MKLIFKRTLNQGILMGLGFCLYTTLMWLTKLDTTYLSSGQYLDIAIIILPIAMIIWAIKQENNINKVTALQRVAIAIFVAAVSYVIYEPFLYVYHHYINPEWFTSVLNLKEMELKAVNTSQGTITNTLEKMKDANRAQSGMFRISSLVPSVIIIPSLIALSSIFFIRRKEK